MHDEWKLKSEENNLMIWFVCLQLTYDMVCLFAITYDMVCLFAITYDMVCLFAITYDMVCLFAIIYDMVCSFTDCRFWAVQLLYRRQFLEDVLWEPVVCVARNCSRKAILWS